MRKKILVAVGVVAVVSVAVFGWNWMSYGRYMQSTDNATIDGDIVSVSSKVSGQIALVAVADNQRVKAGDSLFQIDDSDLRAAYDERKAALDAAYAAVQVAQANLAVTENAIIEAQATLKSAQAEYNRADADYRRYGKLNKSQFASQQRYQTARATAISAKSDVDRAKAALDTETTRLDLRRAELTQAKANAASQKASLDAASIRLHDTVVRAPKDGVVGNIGIRVGQYFSTGQRAMSLVPVDDVYVTANYKETQIEHMQPGQAVVVHVDAYPDHEFIGSVDSVSPGAGSQFSLLPPENATGNFTKIVQRIPVKIRVQSEENYLLIPGMSVEAEVDTRDPKTSDFGHLSNTHAFVQAPKPVQVAEPRQ